MLGVLSCSDLQGTTPENMWFNVLSESGEGWNTRQQRSAGRLSKGSCSTYLASPLKEGRPEPPA